MSVPVDSVPVEIVGLFVDPGSGSSIVLLAERNEITHVLPIFIGPAEAQAIALALQGITPPRPQTHDLMVDVMAILDGRLDHVTVTDLRDGAFLAELVIDTDDGEHRVSSRPSDGIALAVRVGAPVHVVESVLEEAAVRVDRDPSEPFSEEEIEGIVTEFEQFLETATPADFAENDALDENDLDDDPLDEHGD